MTEINLHVNDENIPLNPIMSAVLTNIIKGFIDVLKDIPEEKKNIRIEISD